MPNRQYIPTAYYFGGQPVADLGHWHRVKEKKVATNIRLSFERAVNDMMNNVVYSE